MDFFARWSIACFDNWAMTSNNGRFLNEAAAAGDGINQAPRYSVADKIRRIS